MSYGLCILIEGNEACFTKPELKVERVSYDVPTPSALIGLIKAIYWDPAIEYVLDKFAVLNPIVHATMKKNEVSTIVSLDDIKKQMADNSHDICIYTGLSKNRTQRVTNYLKNVRYVVKFHFEMTGIKSENGNDNPAKHYNILKRRLKKGQHYKLPCLGLSEMPTTKIELVHGIDESLISQEIIDMGDVDLGFMLYGLNFEDGGIPINNDWKNPVFSNESSAVYYHPHMINGIVDVKKYREEMKCL